MKKDQIDIHGRIFEWVISCLLVVKQLPNDQLGQVIKYQFAKSSTSVGANDQEANNASSKIDFIAKYKIVKKELAESLYWLRIINSQFPFIKVDKAINEGQEILNIVSTIILKASFRV